MVNLKYDYITKNKYTRPGKKLKAVKKIVLHWTANPGASALNHVKYFGVSLIESNKRKEADGKKATCSSAHIFIDTKDAICIIPLDEMAYHSNDGSFRGIKELKPNANELSIGVEMCVEEDGTISPITIKNTVQIIAELCKTYKLDENDIVRHYDVTKKNCPMPFIKDPTKFDTFKNEVGSILKPKSNNIHIVKSGDTLYKIANQNKVPIQQIVKLNHLKEESLIFPGQKLKLK